MGGPGFDYRATPIGHSVADGSPYLQRFSSEVRSCVGQIYYTADNMRTVKALVTFFENLIALPNGART